MHLVALSYVPPTCPALIYMRFLHICFQCCESCELYDAVGELKNPVPWPLYKTANPSCKSAPSIMITLKSGLASWPSVLGLAFLHSGALGAGVGLTLRSLVVLSSFASVCLAFLHSGDSSTRVLQMGMRRSSFGLHLHSVVDVACFMDRGA